MIMIIFSPIDAYNPDLKKFPKFSKARAISFEQRPGELLIIPPGWFHQVQHKSLPMFLSSGLRRKSPSPSRKVSHPRLKQ